MNKTTYLFQKFSENQAIRERVLAEMKKQVDATGIKVNPDTRLAAFNAAIEKYARDKQGTIDITTREGYLQAVNAFIESGMDEEQAARVTNRYAEHLKGGLVFGTPVPWAGNVGLVVRDFTITAKAIKQAGLN